MDFYRAKQLIQERARKEAESLGTFSIAQYLEIEKRLWEEFKQSDGWKECEKSHSADVKRWIEEDKTDWDSAPEEDEEEAEEEDEED